MMTFTNRFKFLSRMTILTEITSSGLKKEIKILIISYPCMLQELIVLSSFILTGRSKSGVSIYIFVIQKVFRLLVKLRDIGDFGSFKS